MSNENATTAEAHPPAELAAHYMGLAKTGKSYRSKILRLLHKRPLMREPSIRTNQQWSVAEIDKQVRQTISKLEAITLQIVGTHPSEPCESCKEGRGPFVACISLHEDADKSVISACANCHWSGNDEACDFDSPTAPYDRSWQLQQVEHDLAESLVEKDAQIAALRAEKRQLLGLLNHIIIQHSQRYDWMRINWNFAHELIHQDARYAALRGFVENKLEECQTLIALRDLRARMIGRLASNNEPG